MAFGKVAREEECSGWTTNPRNSKDSYKYGIPCTGKTFVNSDRIKRGKVPLFSALFQKIMGKIRV